MAKLILNIRLADQNPGDIGNLIVSICSYPGDIGNLIFFLLSWKYLKLKPSYKARCRSISQNCICRAIYFIIHRNGNLCSNRRHASSHIQVMSFSEIRLVLQFSAHDHHFLLGEHVIKRTGEWPMGASLSEICSMCDLNHDVWKCATKQEDQ